MQARLVAVACLGVAGADGSVEGAADLLVEQGVLGVLGDLVVGADDRRAGERDRRDERLVTRRSSAPPNKSNTLPTWWAKKITQPPTAST